MNTLLEFDLDNINNHQELLATIATEVVLLSAIKISVNKMMKRSKLDKKLSDQISNITDHNFKVRILKDDRLISFDSNDTLWISEGLMSLLNGEEVIGILLHEIGHGQEKLKLLYDKMTRNPKNPKKMKPLFSSLSKMLKKRGVRSDPVIMARTYFVTFLIYSSVIGDPFEGLYKWSYSNYSIKFGYWDAAESAINKIQKYIKRKNINKAINELGSSDVDVTDHIDPKLSSYLDDSNDNLYIEIKKLSPKDVKVNRSLAQKILRYLFK